MTNAKTLKPIRHRLGLKCGKALCHLQSTAIGIKGTLRPIELVGVNAYYLHPT